MARRADRTEALQGELGNGAAVTTELVDHLTHEETKRGVEELYATSSITADDVAEIIAFAVGRPPRSAQRDPRPRGRTGLIPANEWTS